APPAGSQPPAPESRVVFDLPRAPRPPASPSAAAQKFFSPDEPFVFDPGLAQMLEAVRPVKANKPPKPAAADETPRTHSPAGNDAPPKPEVSAASAASERGEPEPAAPKPSASEKTGTIKTAMVEALAVLKRLAANTQTSSKPARAAAAPPQPVMPAEIP